MLLQYCRVLLCPPVDICGKRQASFEKQKSDLQEEEQQKETLELNSSAGHLKKPCTRTGTIDHAEEQI